MGFAISLRSDHPSAGTVRALWRDAAPFEERPSMARLGYPPHITLAIYDDGVREDEARDALDHACRDLPALRLTFDAIRTFEGPPLVLWAAPRPDPMLYAAHAAIHAVIDPAGCRPHYRPGAWIPHCSLATQVRHECRDDALAFAHAPRAAFEVIFDALDCIAFPSLMPLALRRLP
ncbi:2'-5' RNA ligase family protein [Methylobacterium terricola]|uniref:2'-5' RNA ligase family protein n=1 Tax=Methylobacterium terricola TaxID=2583531 RepID=A0A5C4LBV0_9HYPH|nr:2'-5' RNA ligase family protein [Methylobacterium terricola]TNC09563.1 2'-5' RNA ligase family protein [Methylobacterium terricola]